jgi:hypothetical protein
MALHHQAQRNRRQGIVLLSVLAGVVLLAALAGTLRARAAATAAVLGRLTEQHRLALAEVSVVSRVRSGGIAVTGAPVTFEQAGYVFEVRATDVEGLVDLYLAPEQVLRLLPVDEAVVSRRNAMRSQLSPGDRYLSEVQTMAAMGLDAADRVRLAPLVTQRARTGEINPELAPPEIRREVLHLREQDIAGGDVAEITVRLLP